MDLFSALSDDSRVWIYQCNRVLNDDEAKGVSRQAVEFTAGWTAHNHQLKAEFALCHNLFLIFCVDENNAAASGCSIDKSVHLVRQLEKDFNIKLLDRMMAAYLDNNDAIPFSLRDLNKLFETSVINNDTIVFNNLITNLRELRTEWQIPLHKSWMTQKLSTSTIK